MNIAEQNASMPSNKYNEVDLKALVLRKLLRDNRLTRKSFLASEFPVGPERRADLALFNGAEFIGIEVKSDFDTLKRLEGQHAAYQKVFDRIIVVVAERHLQRVLQDHCMEAELWSVSPRGEVLVVREGRKSSQGCRNALATLLTKAELAKLVGMERNTRFTRASLASKMDTIDIESIRASVLQSFSGRFEITSRRFFKAVSGTDVAARHVGRLSRYDQQRKVVQAHKRKNEQFWKDWAKAATEVFA